MFLLLQACLGLTIHGEQRQIFFNRPRLPRSLREIQMPNLRVGDALVDLCIRRHREDVGITVERRTGRVEVRVLK